MSAYDEYAEEKRLVDELLAKGYAIVSMREGLEGAEVLFRGPGRGKGAGEVTGASAGSGAIARVSEGEDSGARPTVTELEASRVKVWLLTAEARKYVSYLVLVQQAEAQ